MSEKADQRYCILLGEFPTLSFSLSLFDPEVRTEEWKELDRFAKEREVHRKETLKEKQPTTCSDFQREVRVINDSRVITDRY